VRLGGANCSWILRVIGIVTNWYSDLARVAHSLYPLESHLTFNHVKTFWFPLAITDELLLHTVLFSSAATLSFESEKRLSTEASDIMKPIFRLLASRLEHQSKISDATIGAVSCLAMVEVRYLPLPYSSRQQ